MEPWIYVFDLFCAVGLCWIFLIEPNAFQIQTWRLNFPRKLNRKYRILHLTDIHFSQPRKTLSKFFDRLSSETWDFIFLTGDIFDCNQGAKTGIEELKKLKSNFGTYAVFGNHDHFNYRFKDILHTLGHFPDKRNDIELLQSALESAGVEVLRNRSVSPKVKTDAILIHGLDDPVTDHADYEKICAVLDSDKFNILLTHTIDAFLHLPEDAVQISFSGHSHGGQVRIPGWGAFITHTRFGKDFAQGMHKLKGAVCIVSRGMGTSRYFTFRLFCKPQAVVAEIG